MGFSKVMAPPRSGDSPTGVMAEARSELGFPHVAGIDLETPVLGVPSGWFPQVAGIGPVHPEDAPVGIGFPHVAGIDLESDSVPVAVEQFPHDEGIDHQP